MSEHETGSTARKAASAVGGVVGAGAGAASLAGDDAPSPDAVLAAGDDVLGLTPPGPTPTVTVPGGGANLGEEVAVGRDIEVEEMGPEASRAAEAPARTDPAVAPDPVEDATVDLALDDPIASSALDGDHDPDAGLALDDDLDGGLELS